MIDIIDEYQAKTAASDLSTPSGRAAAVTAATDQALGTTNDRLGTTNDRLGETNQNLGDLNGDINGVKNGFKKLIP